jgi:hypothetical protein
VFGRRLIILVAVLMGLTALAASVAPPPDSTRRNTPAGTPQPSPSPTASPPTSQAGAGVVSRHVDAARQRAPVTITVPQGSTLELAVDVAGPETVALDDVDLQAAAPGSPARFELLADTPGDLPLRLLEAERALGVVRVSAASPAR